MSTELVPINISKEVISQLGDQFSPLFSDIRIYGTVKRPIFISRDVEKALGLCNLHIRDKSDYKEGLHFMKIKVKTTTGLREIIALTEVGLNKAMHSSNNPVAEQYCVFISVVMSELRSEGVVTMERALSGLKEENKKLQATNKMLDEETDRQHYQLAEAEGNESYYRLKTHATGRRVHDLEQEVEATATRALQTGNPEYVELLERAVMKTAYIYLTDATISDDEANDLPENVDYMLKLSQKAHLARGRRVCEIMMVNPVKQLVALGVDHEISITDLRQMVTDSNMTLLRAL